MGRRVYNLVSKDDDFYLKKASQIFGNKVSFSKSDAIVQSILDNSPRFYKYKDGMIMRNDNYEIRIKDRKLIRELAKEYSKTSVYSDRNKDKKLPRVRFDKYGRRQIMAVSIASFITFTGIGVFANSNDDNKTKLTGEEQAIETIIEMPESQDIIETPEILDIQEKLQEESNQVVDDNSQVFMCDIENKFYMPEVQEKYTEMMPIIEKIAPQYGIDPRLVFAVAMQESGCNHEAYLDDNLVARGICQVEKSVWNKSGASLTAKRYNSDTGTWESETLTNIWENAVDVEFALRFLCAFLQWNSNNFSGHNVPGTLVCENMGCGTFNAIINEAAKSKGVSPEELKADPYNQDWLEFREGKPGTFDHVERCARYIEPGATLYFVDPYTNQQYTFCFNCTSIAYENSNGARTN